jgi:electron transfer flavoprotein beta subunit
MGPPEAADQLREALAMGIEEAALLETDGTDWGPQATANGIVEAVRAYQDQAEPYDLLLFGNESADNGNFQVAIRVAHALDLPCLTGVKGLEIQDGKATARREASGGWEIYEVPLPAVISVKEGINLPRYPSLRGKLAAKKKEIEHRHPEPVSEGLQKVRLQNPPEAGGAVEILGEGPGAATRVVEVLKELGVV